MLQFFDSFSVLSRMGFRFLLADSKYRWSRATVLVASGFCGILTIRLCVMLVDLANAALRRLIEEHVGHPMDDAEFERERRRWREEER